MTVRRRPRLRPHGALVFACMLIVASCADDAAPTDEGASDVEGASEPALLLPPRPGERPDVTSGIPHIQLDQTSSDELLDQLAMQSFALETPQHRVKTTKEKPRQASINPQFFTSRDSNRVMPRTVFVGKVRTDDGGGSGEEPKMRKKPAEPVSGTARTTVHVNFDDAGHRAGASD